MQVYRQGAARLIMSMAVLLVASGPVLALSPKTAKDKPGKQEGKTSGKEKGKKEKGKKDAVDPVEAEAIEHFNKGVAFFQEGNYGAALAEFLKSHELVPAFEVRYNIGISYLETGRPVKALEQFEKFLAEGGKSVPKNMLVEVEGLIVEVKGKIGHLELESSEDGAVVVIDDRMKYETPLEAKIPLGAGLHSLVVRKAGFEEFTIEFALTGGETKQVRADLKAVKAMPVEKEVIVKIAHEPPQPPKKKVKKPLRWLWITLGAVGALGIPAVATGSMVLVKRDEMLDAADACTNTLTREACPGAFEARDEGRKLMIATNVLAGLAGAAAIVGITMFILDKPGDGKGKKGKGDRKKKEKAKVSHWLLVTGGASGLGVQALVAF